MSSHRRFGMYVAFGLSAAAVIPGSQATLTANHAFTLSAGVYRIPYADGTSVTVTRDHHDHAPVQDRFDMSGTSGGPYTIVAAADGIIRGIVDSNGDDPEEHSCTDDDTVVGDCSDYNNYVWIEHANGEWTKYTHFATGSVTALGHWVGEAVTVGTPLGTEGDVGAATGPHLHFEVAIPSDPSDPTPFSTLGGFIQGVNVVAVVCDIPDNLFETGGDYVAAPCANREPAAAAGGPYQVEEGSTIQLDGTGSSDPDGDTLAYSWSPATHLDDPTSATPIYSAVDDAAELLTLTVTDQGDVTPASALSDSETTTVTVTNVAPAVTVQGAVVVEGGLAMVSATFTDPGVLDTHTATITWGDGTAPQPVAVVPAPGGGSIASSHVYGDNGSYMVLVTVTDDDGGVGGNSAAVQVGNLNPSVSLDLGGIVSFPGGDYFVVGAGGELPGAAQGSDPGSDDLTFTWSTGDENTYFNNGMGPDPFPSPLGTLPFHAADAIDAVYAAPGVQQLGVVLTDDDGGSDQASAEVIVTGNAATTEGLGWWKHQFSGTGSSQIDSATSEGYLAIVNAVSSVFSESVSAATAAQVHALLSPHEGDRRARALAELMLAWLQFASGAVSWDAPVPLGGKQEGVFSALMAGAEAVILNPAATDAQLMDVEQTLRRVRQAD